MTTKKKLGCPFCNGPRPEKTGKIGYKGTWKCPNPLCGFRGNKHDFFLIRAVNSRRFREEMRPKLVAEYNIIYKKQELQNSKN